MRIILVILIFSVNDSYSQINYVRGVSITGKEGYYKATALPTTTTVQTSLNHKSDSLKTLWRWAGDLQKTIKVLRDSIALMSIPDTLQVKGNGRVRQIRKHYSELEIYP